MNSRSGRSQKIRHSYRKIYLLAAALCVVTALAVGITVAQLGTFSGKKPAKTLPKDPVETSANSSAAESEEPTTGDEGNTTETSGERPAGAVTYVTMKEEQLSQINPLLIVNAEHPFDPKNADGMVVIKTAAPPEGGVTPAVYTWNNLLNSEALGQLQLLQGKMTEIYGDGGKLFINSSYTSLQTEKIESVYDVGLTGTKCSDSAMTDVRYSTHATGYVVDVRYNDGKYLASAEKSAITAFLLENAASYGWIQSRVVNGIYVPGATAATRDDWHLQYVGVPHALYMKANGLTLEQYMEALRKTGYGADKRLTVTSGTTVYEMYFWKAEKGETSVPVPQGSNYSVVGNGVDGYIVTITTTP